MVTCMYIRICDFFVKSQSSYTAFNAANAVPLKAR